MNSRSSCVPGSPLGVRFQALVCASSRASVEGARGEGRRHPLLANRSAPRLRPPTRSSSGLPRAEQEGARWHLPPDLPRGGSHIKGSPNLYEVKLSTATIPGSIPVAIMFSARSVVALCCKETMIFHRPPHSLPWRAKEMSAGQ